MYKSALIFGASGVSGWAFVNEMLNDYPKKGVWGKVHALTNRPLKQGDSLWPNDPRLNIVSGIDLLQGSQEELEQTLKDRIEDVNKVTHVFYLAYKAGTDVQREVQEAVAMWQRSTIAMNHLSPSLEFVVLQTGAKAYGVHLLENHPTNYIHVPLHESLPRLRPPYDTTVFYYQQIDWVKEYAKDKKWIWIETRPDQIIGFIPNGNFYSLATSIGVYLSLYAAVEGKGADCPFPGTWKTWEAKNHDVSADMIARQTLYLVETLPRSAKGEAYNVADGKEPVIWKNKWPIICRYFGLKGTPPPENATGREHEVRAYIKKHFDTWQKLEKQYGLREGIADSPVTFPGFELWVLSLFDFDRQYDMTKMYATGFTEQLSTLESWGAAFGKMRKAKHIP